MLLLLMLALAACSGRPVPAGESGSQAEQPSAAAGSKAEKELPKVAFVYLGVPGDGGWTYQHDLARKAVEEKFGLKATVLENIPDTADAERVFTQLAQENDIVFGTSYGYMDAMVNVAAKFPDVVFAHSTGYKLADNLSTYTGRDYEAGYLSGIAAGKMTNNDKLGYVGSFPIPEVINTINGFTLGAQSVNPDVEVYVTWSNTWYDPMTERQAAISLLDQGVDVLATYQDSPAGIQAAAERGAYGIGNDSDMNKYVPETYITNPVWNFEPFYSKVIQSVIDGTFKSEAYYGGMEDGMIELAPLGQNVPQDVRELIEQKQKDIVDNGFEVFTGPLYDQSGAEKVAAGAAMSDGDILSMNWFVKGIVGTIPQ
ncbi:BMP family ABC transporter substrate-binding protein [Paenibacillus thailandensis]|uniref:BMP family ABC transporter substrate-binding protein n=1 Tax=Paenibacillus thailandensis TaxID=393250 RepID=A0ABW5QU62_9BACL